MGPVKDFVRDVWKIAAACAAGAFLLSLVIGLIAGNPFGVALFRALLSSVLFAGLGAGLRVVVKGYLPELLASNEEKAGKTGADESADHRGAAVDIVLPEDDGLRRQAYSGSPRSARASSSESVEADGEPDEVLDADSMHEDSASQAEAQALGELSEELAEELPGAPDSAEEAKPEGELPRSARESTEDLDSLPDIAALEAPTELNPGPGSTRSSRIPTSGERPGDAVRNVLSGQDPATLARALRTVLKKDEKG